jgi:hypothetical protein
MEKYNARKKQIEEFRKNNSNPYGKWVIWFDY